MLRNQTYIAYLFGVAVRQLASQKCEYITARAISQEALRMVESEMRSPRKNSSQPELVVVHVQMAFKVKMENDKSKIMILHFTGQTTVKKC